MPLSNEMNEMKLCIACAEEIKAQAALCRHCNTRQNEKKFLTSRPVGTQELLAKYGIVKSWLVRRDEAAWSKPIRYVAALMLALYLLVKIAGDLLLEAQFIVEGRGGGAFFTHESFFLLTFSTVLAAVALLLSRPNLVLVLASAALIGYLYDLQHNIALLRFSWTSDPLYLVAQLQSEGFSSEYVVSDALFWVSQLLFPVALVFLFWGFRRRKRLT